MMVEKMIEGGGEGVLGKAINYPEKFDANLLIAIPRELKRKELGLVDNQLPFQGEDIWNAYELSWLNSKGKPIVAIGEFHFGCDSKYLVESKSFKLYLNSYNQTRFNSWDEVQCQLIQDLNKITTSEVKLKLIDVTNVELLILHQLQGVNIDDLDIEMDDYHYQPELLADAITDANSDSTVSEVLNSHLLKSNCLITGQPDWGSIEISYSGRKIKHECLLKYIISFRLHNEFHEQCVERIWSDIMYYCKPQRLSVYARYSRRGGLDINPFRSNFEHSKANSRLARQ